jgi:hypothetical protein
LVAHRFLTMTKTLRACFSSILPLLSACGPAGSPEQQVRSMIEEMEIATEQRDVGDVLKHLSDQYADASGMGREDAARYLRGYFIANQAIHLLTRVQQIEFPATDEARANVLVGMVGRDADASSSWDLAADLYEFDVTLRREDGDWKVTYAKWQPRGR